MLGIFTLCYVSASVLLIAVAGPLIERRVKPNGWYGFRVPKTLSNDDIWYAANEYSGRALRGAGYLMLFGTLFVGALAWLLRLSDGVWLTLDAVATLGPLTWAVYASLRFLQKL